MSVKSPIKKTHFKSKMLEPSTSLRMSEHLTDSFILKSRKTYGKNKVYRNLAFSSENGDSLSAFVSEELKKNGTLLPNLNEEVRAEEKFKSVIDNNSENSRVQNGSAVISQFCLFNDEDTDYYFSVSTDSPRHRGSSPFPEASSSGSNYQRTRKNLKNRLDNQQYSSEDISEPMSHEDNSNYLNNSESKSNFLKPKQSSSVTKQNSILSLEDQAEHPRGEKSPDAGINKVPQNRNMIQIANQAGKISSKGTMLQNSTNVFSILNVVSRFAASSYQAPAKSNPSNKRKRNQKECESIPAKKTLLKNPNISSKVNSVEKKIQNSAISVGNYGKSTILKSNASTVNNQGALKKDSKTPSKALPKGNKKSGDITEVGVGMLHRVNGLNKASTKTPTKAVQKGNKTPVDSTERSIQILQQFVSKNETRKMGEIPKSKRKYTRRATSGHLLVRNETTPKIQSYNDGKQIEKSSVQSEECIVHNQAVNNVSVPNFVPLMPIIIAPNPPISQEGATPLFVWGTPITHNSFQSDNHAISFENCGDFSIPGPSTVNNNLSSLKDSDYYPQNVRQDETITSTTIINQNGHQLNHVFRSRTHVSEGMNFQQFMAKALKNNEKTCFFHCKERSSETFLKNPSWFNLTVQDFFDIPRVVDTLLDYINELDMDNAVAAHNPNKGYDFPENFGSENLLGVVKDFVHTAVSYMIPTNSLPPSHVSYCSIAQAALLKMSSREFQVITHVFRNSENKLKLKDVISRLSLVALFVLFDEYNNKIKRGR